MSALISELSPDQILALIAIIVTILVAMFPNGFQRLGSWLADWWHF